MPTNELLLVPVPLPASVIADHAAIGGRGLTRYQADLGGPLYLSVVIGSEPFLKGGGYGRHASVSVQRKDDNSVVRAPSADELELVRQKLLGGAAVETSYRTGSLIAHLWHE